MKLKSLPLSCKCQNCKEKREGVISRRGKSCRGRGERNSGERKDDIRRAYVHKYYLIISGLNLESLTHEISHWKCYIYLFFKWWCLLKLQTELKNRKWTCSCKALKALLHYKIQLFIHCVPPATQFHTPMAQPSGDIWGSVSSPRTLWHADWRSLGSNQQSSD